MYAILVHVSIMMFLVSPVPMFCLRVPVPCSPAPASASENVDEDILKLGVGPYAVEIDLMQPLDPTKSPKVHVPPLNHIGLWVDDLAAAVADLEAAGVRFAPGGIRKGASGHNVAFIHPKGNADKPLSGEGVLIELVQAPDDVRNAHPPETAK